MKLEGKTVIITDASCPVGAAVARRFMSEGARLALNFPPAGPGADAQRLIEDAEAAGHMAGSAAPASKAQVDGFIADAMSAFGKIDVLVHSNNDIKRLGCSNAQTGSLCKRWAPTPKARSFLPRQLAAT